MNKGRGVSALNSFKEAVKLRPDYTEAHYNLGYLLLQAGQLDEARSQFQKVVDLRPKFVDAHYNLGRVLFRMGRVRDAVEHFTQVVEISPENVPMLNFIGWMLATAPDATVRNGAMAIKMAQKAEELTGQQEPEVIATLAAAYAESGMFTEAISTARRARTLASTQGNSELVAVLDSHLRIYELGQPLREDHASVP